MFFLSSDLLRELLPSSGRAPNWRLFILLLTLIWNAMAKGLRSISHSSRSISDSRNGFRTSFFINIGSFFASKAVTLKQCRHLSKKLRLQPTRFARRCFCWGKSGILWMRLKNREIISRYDSLPPLWDQLMKASPESWARSELVKHGMWVWSKSFFRFRIES